jgi:predicted transcriptional regulator
MVYSPHPKKEIVMEDFEQLSLSDQVGYFGPALGLDDDETEILHQLVINAPVKPSPRSLERFLGVSRAVVKDIFVKIETMGLVKFNDEAIDFSGLIKALAVIPSVEKKRLFDAVNDGE